MKKCPSCNKLNVDENKFCASCGKKLPSKNTCPSCSKKIDSKDTFCKNCGESLKRPDKLKPKRRKISRLKKTFIALGSFIGFLVVLYLATFIYVRFFFPNQYTLVYNAEGDIELIQNKATQNFPLKSLLSVKILIKIHLPL